MARGTRLLFLAGVTILAAAPARGQTFGDLFTKVKPRSFLPGSVEPGIADLLLRLTDPAPAKSKSVAPELLQAEPVGGELQHLQPARTSDQTASIPQTGTAVWYRLTGRTASGEPADPNALTAGHRTLPFGSRVKVVNTLNGRSISVRINDHGPRQHRFIIDLSRASARALGISGTAPVSVSVESLGSMAQVRREPRDDGVSPARRLGGRPSQAAGRGTLRP
jgi:rare lipoprotein A